MIDFQPLRLSQKDIYDPILQAFGHRGCEYNFTNLYAWGRQQAAMVEGNLCLFSQFSGQSIYPFPIGFSNPKPTIDALISDAKERGIAFRITSLSQEDCAYLQRTYPDMFHYHIVRSHFDYVYDINDLADLKGKKLQKKRNHVNRFRQQNPDARVLPLSSETLPLLWQVFDLWYESRQTSDPHSDVYMERVAAKKALEHWQELGLEGLVLMLEDRPVAATVASRLCGDTFDVHFEKAAEDVDGAYPVINREFAGYLRSKYPEVKWLNREDDLGIEGLRKAKLSYHPAFLLEKHWAALKEDGYDY